MGRWWVAGRAPDHVTIPAFVNPDAARAKSALAALRDREEVAVRLVSGSELGDQIATAVSRGADRIVVAGGDGSIARAAAVIAGTPVDLGLIPGGTLNHLAKDLGLPLDLEQAAQLAASGRAAKAIDVGLANGRVFLNTGSIGAYARFVRARERLERVAGYWLATLVAAVRLFIRLPLYAVEIELAGERRRYLTPLVFIGVGERELRLPTLGGRVPNGARGLHVIIVRGRTRARLVALALAAAARGLRSVTAGPALDAFLVHRCRIELPTGRTSIAIDGEIVDAERVVEFALWPDALKVVVPDGATG